MIRFATPDDIDWLVQAGAEMASESRYRTFFYDQEAVREALARFIDDDDKVVLIADGGFFVGGAMRLWWSPDTLIAYDDAMYIKPEYRGTLMAAKLLTAFCKWAKAAGCSEACLGVSTEINDDRWLKFVTGFGFEASGFSARRAL